jgi:hypothetical protein
MAHRSSLAFARDDKKESVVAGKRPIVWMKQSLLNREIFKSNLDSSEGQPSLRDSISQTSRFSCWIRSFIVSRRRISRAFFPSIKTSAGRGREL